MCVFAGQPAALYDLLTVSDVMAQDVHCLPIVCTVKAAAQLLSATNHNGFPVHDVEPPHCFRGTILRSQLMVLLENQVWLGSKHFTNQEFNWATMAAKKDIDELDFARDDWEKKIDLGPYANQSAFSVPVDFSCSIAFRLFRSSTHCLEGCLNLVLRFVIGVFYSWFYYANCKFFLFSCFGCRSGFAPFNSHG